MTDLFKAFARTIGDVTLRIVVITIFGGAAYAKAYFLGWIGGAVTRDDALFICFVLPLLLLPLTYIKWKR